MAQPGKVANPARGQLNRENIPLSSCVPENMVSRDVVFFTLTDRASTIPMGSAVPSRVSLLVSILRLNLVLTYGIPPEFRGGDHL